MSGGAELLCDELILRLNKLGNAAELIAIPFKWYPPSQLLLNAFAWRSLDLSEVNGQPIDLVISTKYLYTADSLYWGRRCTWSDQGLNGG